MPLKKIPPPLPAVYIMNAAREGWKVFSDCGHTWWFSRAASRPVSLSNYITFDVCFFSGFMKSSIIYAVTLRTVIRFETMIWPITELKKSVDIFLLWLERKHSEEYLVILLVVKRKLWAIFLPRVYLEKIANTSKLKLKFKGAVSRNSAKLGNYKMPVKLRET